MQFTALAARPGLAVGTARCTGGHDGWSGDEVRADYRLVLVRRGRFRRRTAAGQVDPGDE